MSDANWSNVNPLPGMGLDEMQMLQTGGKVIPVFHTAVVKNEYKSKLEGRDVFQEEVRIQRICPGDPKNSPVNKLRQTDIDEFPIEYARWQKTRENIQTGFPIDNWHVLSAVQKAELKSLHIHTVEQLANLSDGAGQQIMGFNDLRKKANILLNAGKDAELIGTIRAEANAKEEQLKKEIAELRALIEGKTAPAEKVAK